MPAPASETDRSGSIAAGGTAQDVYTDQPFNFVTLQNTSDTVMRFEFGANATGTTGRLLPANGGYWECSLAYIPAGRLSIFCASTGKTFLCKTL
jgi:hypothetical protein